MATRTLSQRLSQAGGALGRLPVALAILAALTLTYVAVLHPWMTTWGASAAEQELALPGDGLPASAANYRTRGITVQAPPEVVWQWIVQIGQDRAGFYSNDWLENLFGGDIHNSNELRPEWAVRSVGDRVPMAPVDYLWGSLGDATYLPIKAVEPNVMITDLPGRFVLIPREGGSTRVLLREPYDGPVMGEAFAFWVFDPMHFVMEQRMLQGIKERAEGRAFVPGWLEAAARVGWLGAGLALAGLFLRRRRWALAGVLSAVSTLPVISSTGDLDSALAGFLAVGITAMGFLAHGRRFVAPFALLAASVLFTLLLAPDPYTAFGLAFDAVLGTVALAQLWKRGALPIPAQLSESPAR